jgi:Rha family phage regulatory protein
MSSLSLPSKQNPLIHIWRNKVTTSSLAVAEYFGKRHTNVLRAIKNLECSEEFNRLNFAPVKYIDKKCESQPAYELTKDGFAMLAFGFTGKQAAAFKERYINAFNEMLEGYPAGRIEAINAKRVAHAGMTDAIKERVESQGKDVKSHHFMCENKLCNWAIRGEFKSIDESTLLAWEAKLLERVRNYNETLLLDGLEYDARKGKLKGYADRQRAYLMPKVALLERAA